MLVLHLNRFSGNHGFFVSKFFIFLVGWILSPCPPNEFMGAIVPKFFHVWECPLVDFITLSNTYYVLAHSHLSGHFCVMFHHGVIPLRISLIVFPLDITWFLFFFFYSRCLYMSFHVLKFSNFTWIGLVDNNSRSLFPAVLYVLLIMTFTSFMHLRKISYIMSLYSFYILLL